MTHIARRSNPYDIRGTSLLNRLFRCYVPGTTARMSDGSCKPIEEVKVVVSGGITDVRESNGVALTGQTWVYTDTISVQGLNEVSIESPEKYILAQNYPNPFNPSTTIQFAIPEQSFVKLEIFNTLGEKVDVLLAEELNAGTYRFDWNAKNLTSGIYYYSLTADNFRHTRKLILLK